MRVFFLRNIKYLLLVWFAQQAFSQGPIPQLQQAENYLVQHKIKSKFNYLLLKFFSSNNRVLTPGFLNQLDSITRFESFTDEANVNLFFKLIYPSQSADTNQVFKERGLQRWMLWTLYADQLHLDHRYYQLTDSLIGAGNARDLTHIGIFLGFLGRQKPHSKLPGFLKLKKRTVPELRKIYINNPSDQDTWFEAIVGMQLINKSKMLTNDVINRILFNQNTDGGWSFTLSKDTVTSNEHSTVLALWLINNYFYYQHD